MNCDIHPTSIINKGAKIGKNVSVGAFSIIGPNVKIVKNSAPNQRPFRFSISYAKIRIYDEIFERPEGHPEMTKRRKVLRTIERVLRTTCKIAGVMKQPFGAL